MNPADYDPKHPCSPVPPYKAPHMSLTRVGEPPEDAWQCSYCFQAGTWDEIREIACTFIHDEPCPHCGNGMPYCAPDCSGIEAILGSPNVHVVGGEDPR